MRPRPALRAFPPALGLLTALGCGPAKLNETQPWTLEPGDAQVIELGPQPEPQKITVECTSCEGEVNVCLIKDCKKDDGLDTAPTRARTLDSKQAKEGSMSADGPKKTAVRVAVRGAGKKTD